MSCLFVLVFMTFTYCFLLLFLNNCLFQKIAGFSEQLVKPLIYFKFLHNLICILAIYALELTLSFITAAKLDASISKYFTTPESDEIRVEIQVELLSPVSVWFTESIFIKSLQP